MRKATLANKALAAHPPASPLANQGIPALFGSAEESRSLAVIENGTAIVVADDVAADLEIVRANGPAASQALLEYHLTVILMATAIARAEEIAAPAEEAEDDGVRWQIKDVSCAAWAESGARAAQDGEPAETPTSFPR